MEFAAIRQAIKARITASGAAPPLNEMPAGMESAVAIAGAMNVMDWKSTPLKLTAPRLRAGAPPASAVGTSVVIGSLLRVADRTEPRVNLDNVEPLGTPRQPSQVLRMAQALRVFSAGRSGPSDRGPCAAPGWPASESAGCSARGWGR